MAQLIVQTVALAGGAMNLVPAGALGDTFGNDGRTYLRVKNDGAAQMTTTINSPTPCNQGATHDVVVTVPAGEDRIVGPFDPTRFGLIVVITYSAFAGVTVAAYK